jgi:pyrimidine operon attenuation protein/uracil phosphoribosyltransferase
MQILLSPKQLHLTILRLAHHITENYSSLENLVFIGIQPRGVKFSDRLIAAIRQIRPNEVIQYGILDITFYRDDIRDELHIANKTDISFSIEDKLVVLMDDVLYTGRTTRAALDALQDFGRPEKVMLCVLVDRRFNRELPIQPDFSGKTIDTMVSQKVKVEWDREEVVVY